MFNETPELTILASLREYRERMIRIQAVLGDTIRAARENINEARRLVAEGGPALGAPRRSCRTNSFDSGAKPMVQAVTGVQLGRQDLVRQRRDVDDIKQHVRDSCELVRRSAELMQRLDMQLALQKRCGAAESDGRMQGLKP
jgi:hypothetical protein